MNSKLVNLYTNNEQLAIEDAIPLDEYKKEFLLDGFEYSDEQLIKIRAFFKVMAQIAFEQYERQQLLKDNTSARILKLQNEHDTKSHFIHSGEYRRTG